MPRPPNSPSPAGLALDNPLLLRRKRSLRQILSRLTEEEKAIFLATRQRNHFEDEIHETESLILSPFTRLAPRQD